MKTVGVEEVEVFSRRELYRLNHPTTLTLDITHLSPEQAAAAILRHAEAGLIP